jgi:hypothetical protein
VDETNKSAAANFGRNSRPVPFWANLLGFEGSRLNKNHEVMVGNHENCFVVVVGESELVVTH